MTKLLRGTYTAIITPFDDAYKIDWSAFQRLVDKQVQGGIDGIVFLGTTGECTTLSTGEQTEVFRRSIQMVNGRAKVIHGTGSNSTSACIEHAKIAEEAGADAQLIVVPYYNKPSQEGLYRHYMTIADATKVPIIVYNIKSRTGVNLETATLMRLAKHQNIVAIKEASGDIVQMMDVIKNAPNDFSLLSGDDGLTLPFMACGGDGVISVLSNCVPKAMSSFIDQCLYGNYEVARTSFYQLIDLMKGIFIESNPIPIKEIMGLLGYCSPNMRLPLCRASESSMKQIEKMVEYIKTIEK